MAELDLTPARESDFEALVALRIEAMRDSLERVGRFDPARARERFRSGFIPEHTRWIVSQGERVGFVVVKPIDSGLLLDHLYLSAAAQGQGIGGAALKIVFAEADAKALPIRVGALKESDSNRFYLRHGFQLVEEAEWDNYYIREPAAPDGILAAYDPSWPETFAEFRAAYVSALGGLIVGVEHIGSTAIPGLTAKPILDIDLIVQNSVVFPEVVEALGKLGYGHKGNQGIEGREVFKPLDRAAPFTEPCRDWMQHHLYVCSQESDELRRHIRFRDTLCARSDLRSEYEQLKQNIAIRSNGDRKVYAQIKESECRDFVERVLQASI